jgi:purine-binding chemotaxis protein CheW
LLLGSTGNFVYGNRRNRQGFHDEPTAGGRSRVVGKGDVAVPEQDQPQAGTCLVFKVESVACALPIAAVVETMRPLPLQRVESAPPIVAGLAMIRGTPTPVIDTARLLGTAAATETGRFITVAVGNRQVALAVTSVVGLRAVTAAELGALPPLLAGAETGAVSAIGTLDRELLLLLRGVRLVPETVFAAIPATAGVP